MPYLSRRALLLAAASLSWTIACAPQSPSSSGSPDSQANRSPLRVGLGIWPGYAGGYVAVGQNLFQAQGVAVEEVRFAELSTSISAFLANKLDVLWATSADAIQMHNQDPTIKMIYLSDYSNGSDGIVGRNINHPPDLKGKTIARENLLFVNVFLRAYLNQNGLSEKDVILKDLLAPDAAAAFAAKQVDAIVTYEPWMTKAAQTGGGKVLFTSKDTNLLADVVIVRAALIASRRPELQALIRAIDAGAKQVIAGDTAALKIVAERLGVSPAEAQTQLAGVKFFDIATNKSIGFDATNAYSLVKNLELTTQAAYDLKITPKKLEIQALYDDSIVRSL